MHVKYYTGWERCMLNITQAGKDACYIIHRLGKMHVTYYTG